MRSPAKKLRSGYTTGACAAAAAKAATLLLLGEKEISGQFYPVTIPFPDGSQVTFTAHLKGFVGMSASASVIKDAGDDPDVTHKAEIVAEARIVKASGDGMISIKGGIGVGTVTKPGLAIPVGEAAVAGVPRKMIRDGVTEAIATIGQLPEGRGILITISVPEGQRIAKKTLNSRLGIVGGISILGTTGIVRPLSAEAWKSTIAVAMDVTRAAGIPDVVFSTGRVSEKAHMKRYGFREEAYIMMGDHVEFSLLGAAEKQFAAIHICAQWAKMVKISLKMPQTHVNHGILNVKSAAAHFSHLGIKLPKGRDFNTARAVYEYCIALKDDTDGIFKRVCRKARSFAESITGGIPVTVHLVSYEGEIISDSQ